MNLGLAVELLRALATSPHGDRFVLRGGLVLAGLSPVPRRIEDVDLLCLDALEEAERMFASVCNGARLPLSSERIWTETPWPGLRFRIVSEEPLQVDIGSGDPVVPLPFRAPIPGDSSGALLHRVRAETLYGWKVHGLFERGEGKWRAKDLWDLFLLQEHAPMDDLDRLDALRVAFESRSSAFELTHRFFTEDWGRSPSSRRKWETFQRRGAMVLLPPLQDVKRAVAAELEPLIARLEGGTPAEAPPGPAADERRGAQDRGR